MQYKRILVLGCCGSGKTTFSLSLGEITGIPVVHLDKLYWKPGWTEPTRAEFHAALINELSKEAWIMDGNYARTLPLRLQYCDSVLYFDLPRFICLWGVIGRFLKNRGRNRLDVGSGCPEKIDGEFIRYTWNFRRHQDAEMKCLLRDSGKPVVVFTSRGAARRYLEAEKNKTAPAAKASGVHT